MSNINTANYWNTVYRKEWDAGQVTSPQYSRDYGPIHDAVVALIPDGSRVLDIACVPGLLCAKIKQRRPASQILGVDYSDVTIQRCRERDRALGVEYGCVDIRRDLLTLGRQFDVVCMCEILEHLDEPERIVSEAMSLLKPGGRFILTCPHDDGIPDAEHVRQWGHDELFHLLAQYGDTVSFTHFPPPWFHLWILAYLTKQDGVAGA